MTKAPDLTLPMARLTMFCGQAFTLIRAECWTGASAGNKPSDSLRRIESTADTLHNIASLGWLISEYTQHQTSGPALLDTCSHLIRRIKAAEEAQDDSLHEGATFDWTDARAALEEIAAEIQMTQPTSG